MVPHYTAQALSGDGVPRLGSLYGDPLVCYTSSTHSQGSFSLRFDKIQGQVYSSKDKKHCVPETIVRLKLDLHRCTYVVELSLVVFDLVIIAFSTTTTTTTVDGEAKVASEKTRDSVEICEMQILFRLHSDETMFDSWCLGDRWLGLFLSGRVKDPSLTYRPM
ncbi:hypothetical protein F2Q70_00016201 [Brassica cretica]|uniref:Uncharacterized protein n=1 Tax=Brassica cretica TaxID=69181 RepID=A0A8S9HZR9_BRACR|nr:hypothetical protein F2Q70_00016201 [Brassica cretica]